MKEYLLKNHRYNFRVRSVLSKCTLEEYNKFKTWLYENVKILKGKKEDEGYDLRKDCCISTNNSLHIDDIITTYLIGFIFNEKHKICDFLTKDELDFFRENYRNKFIECCLEEKIKIPF